ncbi:MAG: hypothetical protein U5K69_25505 [Balneolaceae bacterium]|nr:hypothetical protein [Balneolaceae bacterium]
MAVASCWELGIPFTCLDPDSTDEELRQQLRLLEPSVLIKPQADSSIEYKKIILLQDITVDTSPARSWNTPEAITKYQPEIGPETIFGIDSLHIRHYLRT